MASRASWEPSASMAIDVSPQGLWLERLASYVTYWIKRIRMKQINPIAHIAGIADWTLSGWHVLCWGWSPETGRWSLSESGGRTGATLWCHSLALASPQCFHHLSIPCISLYPLHFEMLVLCHLLQEVKFKELQDKFQDPAGMDSVKWVLSIAHKCSQFASDFVQEVLDGYNNQKQESKDLRDEVARFVSDFKVWVQLGTVTFQYHESSTTCEDALLIFSFLFIISSLLWSPEVASGQ